MVKFNIGLRMNEMKKNIQLQIFHYFMTTKTIGIHIKFVGWKFIKNKIWCNKPNYILMFQTFIMIFQSWEL